MWRKMLLYIGVGCALLCVSLDVHPALSLALYFAAVCALIPCCIQRLRI